MKWSKFVFLFTCILLNFSVLFAITINIPADEPTIQAGIDASVDGDIVLVQPGTYVENINYNGKAITVGSLFYSTQDTTYISQTIIDGNQNDCVVRFENGETENAVLVGFIITNGSIYPYGGGIYCYESNPSLQNVIITGNIAYRGAGGIYCYESNPSLQDVTISDNYCSGSGGGIHCWESNPSLLNVTISDNSSSYTGGGIFCMNSHPSLESVTISDNSTSHSGGGIYCMNSNPSMESVTISGNYANNQGGGMYCYNSSPGFSVVNRCNIFSNTIGNVRGFGSDIFAIECNVIDFVLDTFTVMTPTDYYASPIINFNFDILHSIADSLINTDVFVSVDGDDANSGITPEFPFKTIRHALERIYADSLNINTIHLAPGVYSNSTNGETLPIYWSNNVNLSGNSEEVTILDAENTSIIMEFILVTNAMISNISLTNGNSDYGGAIYCNQSFPSFENVTITGNDAESGGGIYCNQSFPSFENVTITGNDAESGGGIYCVGSEMILENVIIENNSATELTGGGIYCEESEIILENAIIDNNFATTYAGGIYTISSEVIISNSQINNNLCSDGVDFGRGGAIYSYTSSFNLNNCDFRYNSANSHAGAVYLCLSSADIDKCNFIGNSSNGNVGGIYFYKSNHLNITNSTFYNNSGIDSGAMRFYIQESPIDIPVILNTISWNNSPNEILCSADDLTNELMIGYSDFDGGLDAIVTNNNANIIWLEGNLDTDPLFVDVNNENYHLLQNSECIDSGIAYYEYESEILIDLTEDEYYGVAPDMGVFEYELIADFEANETEVLSEQEVFFSDLSNGNPTNWQWDFDNNGIIDSNEPNPIYSYSEPGLYTVSLTISDGINIVNETKVNYINVSQTGTDIEAGPLVTQLIGNYPNPFNPTTTISFSIQNDSNIELTIYDFKGQKVKILVNRELTQGSHSIIWNGTDDFNKPVSSGIYFYKLNVNGKIDAVKKCLLLK